MDNLYCKDYKINYRDQLEQGAFANVKVYEVASRPSNESKRASR